MKQVLLEIIENSALCPNVYKMKLKGDVSDITSPGQFVNIKIDGLFLRRPISVCDCEDDVLTIIYKVVGKGTEILSSLKEGTLDVLTGLGNGYDLSECKKSALLLGGGVGVPPLYMLAKKLISEGKKVSVVLGFNTKSEVFYENEFLSLGADTYVTTVDGTYGKKGFVTDVTENIDYDCFYTCGPEPMLKAVFKNTKTSGQFSFEERMGCGFGACMGCTCKTVTGYKRICKDGPVLKKEEILW
ncbi:MAG: dihydroorotate dehydrogenase electron transfer subunit [Acutalibacteraceae bacterium]|nr:dihydroorotate dehydrogenase electron transfer subunit [Acutalibacteraceae bacterium]